MAARCRAGGRVRRSRLIEGELWCALELILRVAHVDLVDRVGVRLAGDVERIERHRDILAADPEESADTDHHGLNLAVAADQNVADAANRSIILAINAGADQLR